MPKSNTASLSTLAVAATLALSAAPASASPLAVGAASTTVLQPAVTCLRAPACRAEIADSLLKLGKTIRDRAWDAGQKLMEIAGHLGETLKSDRDLAEIKARLDALEKELEAGGRLTPEVRRELAAVRVALDRR